MASLYELTLQAHQLQELLESDVIDEETFNDTLESLDVETKIENICKVIRNLESDAEAFKKEKDRLAARQKTAENGVKRLKQSLVDYLSIRMTKSITTGNFKVSLGSSEKVNIFDESKLPKEFLIPQPPKVDAQGIKTAIKGGATVEGATVEKSNYVTIR